LKPVTPFAELIEVLAPGAGGRTIARLLKGKATRHAALNWKAGRRGTPKWALDMLADEIARRHEQERQVLERARQTKERPGLKAGALNLAKWRARKNA